MSETIPINATNRQRSRITHYRRAHIPGATYFFTVNLARRDTTLLTDHIDALRNAMRYLRARHPFVIDAMWCCPSTCMPFGRFHQAMPTIPCAGA